MSDSNVQALEKISSEVNESQLKIILSSQCLKAQAFLDNKLRKQSEETKQVCNFISNGNFKLENEIKREELEIKSLLSALETIKSANVELNKELLLTKEETNDLIERVNSGIKKYEELWLTSKKRYDNIPLIKEKMQVKNKEIDIGNNINALGVEIQNLSKDFQTRKNELINLDKKYTIEVAEFMTQERPKLLQYIKQKEEEINNLTREINELQNEREGDRNLKSSTLKEVFDTRINKHECEMENDSDISETNNNDSVLLPKLQLQSIDLDVLTDKLEQIRKADSEKSVIKRVDYVSVIQKNPEFNNILVSSNFETPIYASKNEDTVKSTNYSRKKLIHILEDIQLHRKETLHIFSKLDPNEFHDVNTVKADCDLNKTQHSQEKTDDLVMDQNEVTEKVDLPSNDSSNIVVPPTQFLDLSQGDFQKGSQKCNIVEIIDTQQEDCTLKENSQEKKEKFDTAEEIDISNKLQKEITGSQLNTNIENDNSYKILREKVFKKHNLESSPQFTYSKNPIVPKVHDTLVTSNFFDVKDNKEKITEIVDVNTKTKTEVEEIPENIHVNEKQVQDSSVAGFLFTHGSKGLPELLDVSMTSTCVDDSDEFMHCIDSSLLLSPKANMVMPASGNTNSEVLSQELPNFLSGFRKVGFSFFGNSSQEKKADSNNKNPNTDFNFNFGSTEKKSRGGLFNMFH